MARPKTIHIDPLAVLRGIAAAFDAKLGELRQWQADIKSGERIRGVFSVDNPEWHIQQLEAYGCEYDLRAFLGYEPTSSERIRTQQAIRRLERAGLVEITGTRAAWIKPTPEGMARLNRTNELSPAAARAEKSSVPSDPERGPCDPEGTSNG